MIENYNIQNKMCPEVKNTRKTYIQKNPQKQLFQDNLNLNMPKINSNLL